MIVLDGQERGHCHFASKFLIRDVDHQPSKEEQIEYSCHQYLSPALLPKPRVWRGGWENGLVGKVFVGQV